MEMPGTATTIRCATQFRLKAGMPPAFQPGTCTAHRTSHTQHSVKSPGPAGILRITILHLPVSCTAIFFSAMRSLCRNDQYMSNSEKIICPLCNDAVDKLRYRFHIDDERSVIEKIKEQNPAWSDTMGWCTGHQ